MIIFEVHWKTTSIRAIFARIIFKSCELGPYGSMLNIATEELQKKNTPMIDMIFLVSWISFFLDTDVSVNSSKVLFNFLTWKINMVLFICIWVQYLSLNFVKRYEKMVMIYLPVWLWENLLLLEESLASKIERVRSE